MRVVLVSRYPVAGAVWQQWQCLRKYTDLDVRYICHTTQYRDGRVFPHDLLWGTLEARQCLQQAHVVHIHNDLGDIRRVLDRKRQCIIGTLHSVPCPGSWRAVQAVAHHVYCVRQPMQMAAYPRMATLPNLFDCWAWTPSLSRATVIRVVYCPSTTVGGTSPQAKGYPYVLPILQRLQTEGVLQVITFSGVPYLENLRRKQAGHLVIDDVLATHRTFHLTSLEGAAFGQAVLTSVGQADGYPFQMTTLDTLDVILRQASQNLNQVARWGQEARHWMETVWDPRTHVQEYLTAYTRGSVSAGRSDR